MDDPGKLTRRESFAAVAGMAAGLRALRPDDPLARIVEAAGKHGWAAKPIGARVAGAGRALLGTPYVGGTLDRDPAREACVAVWDGLDCVTLVETSLAVARALRTGKPVAESLMRELERIRYRGGRLDDYASRLHYTTDWLQDNASRGVVRLLGSEWGFSKPWSKEIRYMSAHAERYPVLKARPELVEAIRSVEEALSARSLPFVPRPAIREAEPLLADGDLVAFATDVEGLDCSHVGMIALERGAPFLLHASSTQSKVVLDRPLSAYVEAGRAPGVFLARPLEPRRAAA